MIFAPGIEGVVHRIDADNYPVVVKFGSTEQCYSSEGEWRPEMSPTLSHEPYDPPRVVIHKEPQFKAGDKVLVRDEEYEEWVAAIYNSFAGHGKTYPHVVDDATFKQCIPFDINLWNTTEKPTI
jgi:hypothetical protein